jgi:hypothetical protein
MRRIAVLALCMFALSCASSSVDQFPQRRCLFDSQRRFLTGTVIDKRDDGARLFKFDDPTQGDRGFRWVDDNDGVTIRPCSAATASPVGADLRQPETQ